MKGAIILLLLTTTAQAEDCYVQRFSYATAINCGEGRSHLRTEDNTRDRHRRKDDMPSRLSMAPEVFSIVAFQNSLVGRVWKLSGISR
jgi:hypothetical protein